MTNEQLKKELQIIANVEQNSIEKVVALEALERDDIKIFFSDLLQFGCVCGMIGFLIYYSDTHKFYDEHYYQIEELRTEYEENTGVPLQINNDLKNSLAWFAFEEVAYQLANKFELEI